MTSQTLARRALPALLFAALWLATGDLARAQTRIVVDPEGRAIGTAYVVRPIEADLEPGPYNLVPEGDGKPNAATVFTMNDQTYLGAVVPGLDGATRGYTLTPGMPEDRPAVRIEAEGAGEFAIHLGDALFTRLVIGETKPYLYPVIGPTGEPITRAYPMEDVEGETRDHPHQRSFWFTHGDVNGFDFWASDPINRANPKFGTIRQGDARIVASGGGVGILATANDWLTPDGEVLCTDMRTFRVYASASPRVVDVDVKITAVQPVTFGDTKEGSFGIRVASTMDVNREPGGRIVNAEGITDNDTWGKPSPWVDYTGPVGGETVGVAILNHPESFRYPTTWHVRDYGLFAANPFGYGDFKSVDAPGEFALPERESITFRYRVILHEGTTDEADIAKAFAAYADAPKVMVLVE